MRTGKVMYYPGGTRRSVTLLPSGLSTQHLSHCITKRYSLWTCGDFLGVWSFTKGGIRHMSRDPLTHFGTLRHIARGIRGFVCRRIHTRKTAIGHRRHRTVVSDRIVFVTCHIAILA